MSKHKGKRQKGKQDSTPPSRPAPTAQAQPAATSREAPVAQSAATAAARVESPVESGLRVEGNVIHLPAPAADPSGATNDSSGAHPTPQPERPVEADVSALREATGERERTTVPPAEGEPAKAAEEKAEGEAAKVEGPSRSFFDPGLSDPPKADAKADAPAVDEKKADEKKADAPKVEDKKADAKVDTKKADDKKADAKKPDAKRSDVAAPKGALGRDRKESLSSHLSDEARACLLYTSPSPRD